MQMQQHNKRFQKTFIIKTNHRFLPTILTMLCMTLFVSALASGQGWDYGDAPDPPYPTKAASDGARHEVKPGIYMGSGVDADPIGQHTAGATGDDNDGNDDEDGVSLPASLTPGSSANAGVTVSTNGYLSAWIDFNGDGDWADSGEKAINNVTVIPRIQNNLSFSIPAGAVSGSTYARFRFTSYDGSGMPPTGAQDDGEVEDYMVTIGQAQGNSLPVADANGPYQGLVGQSITFDGSGSYDPDYPEDDIVSWEWDMDADGQFDDASGEIIQWQWDAPYSGDVGLKVTDGMGASNTAIAEVTVTAEAAEMDFGDAPEPYPTLLASNGARHIINPEVFLGSPDIDSDPNGQPEPSAQGDDGDGNDDEDGVNFTSALMQGTTATVDVIASVPGRLNAWIDFNRNGSWAESEDQIFKEQQLIPGVNNLAFNVPAEIVPGLTFARFRFSLGGDISYDGQADDGEVEDYPVEIGAEEPGGEPGIDIEKSTNGEDADEPPGPIIQAGTQVTWMYIVTNTGDVPLTNVRVEDSREIIVTYPKGALDAGESMTCTATGIAVEGQYANVGIAFGMLPSGEEIFDEDPSHYFGEQSEMDFGDAPEPTYPTLLESGGARHATGSAFFLGTGVDAEANGLPDANALGDDSNGTDDEDGVTFKSALMQGSSVSVDVVASIDGYLNAWVDFNIDGDWDDTGEQIFTDELLNPGLNMLSISVPTNAVPGSTFARFRFSSVGGVSYKGDSDDGEVEDYQVQIEEAAPGINIEKSTNGQDADFPTGPTIQVGDTVMWTYVVTNTGNLPLTSVTVTDNKGVTVSCPKTTLDVGETMTCTATGTAVAGQYANAGTATGTTPAGEQVSDTDRSHYFGEPPKDYGDAPDTYRTLLGSNGARHIIDPDVHLGLDVDAEPDGQPGAGAQGDDNNGATPDDEDGVTFPSKLIQGLTHTITVVASVDGLLSAWIDFDRSGDWNISDEEIFTDQALSSGSNYMSFTVPANAVTGATHARFRFSRDGGLTFGGEAEDGEVEDYVVEIQEPGPMDFGDAPDPTYPTLLESNGARHIIVSGVYLGNGVDVDANGQPDSNSAGDDFDGNNDDDGIGLWNLAPGESAMLSPVASVDGYLNAWMDFNVDGDWDDAGEQIFRDEYLTAGTNSLKISVPESAKIGYVFGRFRFSTQKGLSYDGLAKDGEVEDHRMSLDGLDYGDAPAPYPTLKKDNGARHIVESINCLGKIIDFESNGLPDPGAMGDDNDGSDDEDAVTFTSALTPGSTATISVANSITIMPMFMLNAWIDFNGDGDWADSGEQIFTDEALYSYGTQNLSFNIPAGAVPGTTFARFRMGSEFGLSYDGLARDGEVEDYQVTIQGPPTMDFGDAPDPTYPTLLRNDGARHVKDPDVYLGSGVDVEPDGQPDSSAQGDDNKDTDDEDGIPLTSSLTQGSINTFTVNASTDGLLNAWIDFNSDGDWEEPDEQIFVDYALVGGSNNVNIKIPLDAKLGTTFARFRFSTQAGLSFFGEANDGEVEDYIVEIDEAEMDFGDAPDPTYPTLLANNGARHVVGSGVYLGKGVDADANGQPNSGSNGDDNDGNDDEDLYWYLVVPGFGGGLYPYASVDGYLNVWIDFNIDGDWDEPDEHLFKDEPLTAGNNSLILYIPESAKVGTTFARFRFSTQRGLSYDGLAEDGEVEDYQMVIYGVDYGDAPPQYPILKYDNGAGHFTEPNNGYYLGKTIDSELNGQPDSKAMGDDNDGTDDEDGVTFTSTLMPGSKATVSVDNSMAVISTGPFVLNAWIDFNIDGDWADAGEQIIKDKTLTYAGTHSLSFSVPASASTGITFARFRSCSNGAGISYDGLLHDGEVEDYQVTIQAQATMDFGDAPDPTYPTLLRNDGARHVKDPDVYLGSGVDVEPDGQPDSSAQGDDNKDTDDEDGIPLTSSLTQGSINTFTVNASTDGLLNAWIDFNIDGDWEEPDEQIFIDHALVGGSNSLNIKIPLDAKLGTTFARFRFSTQGGLSFTGEASDGEVEDYVVEIDEAEMDFGDAPDPTYPTLLTNNGARHVVVPGVYLGNGVDVDANGQPDSNSMGDDCDGNNDEDGIGGHRDCVPGETAAGLTAIASGDGYLSTWVDFNNDGDWADANEQIFTDEPLTAGLNNLTFSIPMSVKVGSVYGRFRFSTQKGLSYDGLAKDGEVEDHRIRIWEFDYGDAPPPYPTLRANNGARHIAESEGFTLGKTVDGELNGLPDSKAMGDDNDGSDDEDGVIFTSALTPGSTATISVSAFTPHPDAPLLNAWVDFNIDGDWADTGEQIFTNKALYQAGTQNLSFKVPAGASLGVTFARFRVANERDLSFVGATDMGEVEDYQVTIQEKATMDFGDAPSPYPTLLADDGARHIMVTRTYLGSGVDVELNGKPDAGAKGDDNADTDDEDGVSGMPSQLIPGDKPNVTVKASLNGFLNAWIDFNADGDWADPEEQVFTDKAINFGANNLNFSVPAVAKSGATFARFRYNTKGGLSFTGMADDGEVEDYQVEIAEPQIDFGDAPDSYGTTLTRDGARHTIVPGVYMGKGVDPETDGQPDAATQGDDNDGNDDEDGVIFKSRLLPGALASIELTVSVDGVLNGWIDFGKDGSFDMSDDYIFSQFVTSGTSKLAFAVPPSAVIGPTVARFRFVTPNIMVYYDGLVGGGEVEDYTVEIEQPGDMDFGDAPDKYLTTMLLNGARHQISPGIYLGSRVDADTDGQPDADARGDDIGRSNDEDGVVFNTALIKGNTTHITVTASVSGWLYAWVDFNIDGDWDDTDEEIFMAKLLSAGANNLKFDVPFDAVVGRTFARFRFIVTPFHTSYYGLSHDGEVEDYMVEIGEAGTVAVWPGDTNNDGMVDSRDILPLGIYYKSTGPPRSSASSNWEMQLAMPWKPEMATYADANGDGVVDTEDILPIGLNWGKVRPIPVIPIAGPEKLAISMDQSRHIPAYEQILEALESLPNTEPVVEMKALMRDVISIARHQAIPEKTAVLQNYPNPFNPETWIPFQLTEDAQVKVAIYDSAGALIRNLDLGYREAGTYVDREYAAYWDGRSDNGDEAASGIYFYRIQAGEFSAVRKMILVR